MIQAVKLYARRNDVENFTKKLEYPIIPNTIALFTKSEKGGKMFYIFLIIMKKNSHHNRNGKTFIILKMILGTLFTVPPLN